MGVKLKKKKLCKLPGTSVLLDIYVASPNQYVPSWLKCVPGSTYTSTEK